MQRKKKIAQKDKLTNKQKKFCEEYIYDWNATRSYKAAYPNVKDDNVAAAASSRLLTYVKIKDYLELIQINLEKLAGISRKKVIDEHMKIAFSSIAHLHNTWIERKEFEKLSDAEKACIAEISTQVRYLQEGEDKTPLQVEYVKIKLYDKQKALDSITKMLGYEAPSKTELTGKNGSPLITSIQIEVINNASQVKKGND